MQIKDIRQFRTWFKKLQKSRHNEWCDENFMGSTYKDFTGFLGMYHGDKDDIYGFLRKEVEMAEDGQAIYEFVQNAADSNSSHFYLFYNEDYFLSVNNGDVFTKEGIKSLLNIGQSFGKTETDQIGRYGIGFKLVHRLVGRTQGLDELLNKDGLGYRGPQLFSWDKKADLRSFIEGDELQYSDFQNESSWLLKILITNFPAIPDEKVLDTDHNSYIPYPGSELEEFRTFLGKCSDFIDINVMDHGSIFFLKLGEGKYEHLLKQENEYLNGLETSMHFLKSLKFIGINDKEIEKDENANYSHRFLIKNGSDEFNAIGLTEERDKKSDIIFHICYANNEENAERIKQKPNIYKYFPAVKEVNNLAMIIHSNVFELTSNRQNLTETPTNQRLLPLLSDCICQYMDDLKNDNPEEFRNLFLSILLSDAPNTNSGNGWQSEYFYEILLEYIKNNVPTLEMEYTSSDDVIIKNTSLQLNPSEFGLAKQWFFWEEIEENVRLIEEAYAGKKLDLYQYSVKNLIEDGNLSIINAWIINLNQENYEVFLNEINEKLPKKNFNELEFILCSNHLYYSVNELISNHDLIMLFEEIDGISEILIQLGFVVSTIKLDSYSNICSEFSKHIDYLKVENNYKLFDSYIKPKTVENELSPQQKEDLFLSMQTLRGVGPEKLKDWQLFKNIAGEIMPLNQLLDSKLTTEDWLSEYLIDDTENCFAEIRDDKFLINHETIYPNIIVRFWNDIIENDSFSEQNIKEFYESIVAYFELSESLIQLNNVPYIFTGSEFLSSNDIFYHVVFDQSSNYQNLRKAIKELTGYDTPVKSILSFLENKPFLTKDDSLKDHIQSADLSEEEALAIIEFSQLAELDLFDYGYFFENEDQSISFSKDKTIIPYFTDDLNIRSFIEENLSSDFIHLPACLSDYKLEVIRASELQSVMLDKLGNEMSDYTETLIDILEGKNLVRFYSEVQEFRIEIKNSYLKSDLEYRLLALLPESLIDDFNEKLILFDSEREFKATEITNIDRFKIEEFNLELSKILIGNILSENAGIVSNLIFHLNKAGLPKDKLSRIFKLDKSIDNEWLKEKINILLETENNVIENVEQLAFVLLYNFHIEDLVLSDIQILRDDDIYDNLEYKWYTQKFSFLKREYTLNEKYFDVNKILKINRENPIFYTGTNTSLLFCPYFDVNNQKFICENIKDDLADNEKSDLLDLIFNYWQISQPNKQLIKYIDWSEINGEDSESIIGFIPSNLIWSSNLAIEKEQVPVWLQEWCVSKESGLEFLSDFGINTDNSPIARIRNSFISEDLFDRKKITNNDLLSIVHLQNTFTWIKENEIDIDTDAKYQIIIAICEEIEAELTEEVDLAKLENDEEWSSQYYENWKLETECEISIFLHQGEMPYIISYDGIILKEITKDDYVFIEDTDSLYVNCLLSSIEFVLDKVVRDEDIPFDTNNLNELFLLKNDSGALVSPEMLLQKDARIAELERQLQIKKQEEEQVYDTNERTVDYDVERQRSSNEEAKKIVKELLQNNHSDDFDCSEWDESGYPSTVINGVKFKGDDIRLIVRSCGDGKLNLLPAEWCMFDDPDTFLVLRYTDNRIGIFGGENDNPKDAIQKYNKTLSINFKSEAFGIQSLDALSPILDANFYGGVGYVFKAPAFSDAANVEEIAAKLSKTNQGKAISFTNDDF